MFVLKSPCSRAERSELPCKTQSFETIVDKHSSSDVSAILITGEKDTYSADTVNPKESPTVRNCSNQEERVTSQSTFRSQLASHKWSRKHQFDTCRSWSQGYSGLLS